MFKSKASKTAAAMLGAAFLGAIALSALDPSTSHASSGQVWRQTGPSLPSARHLVVSRSAFRETQSQHSPAAPRQQSAGAGQMTVRVVFVSDVAHAQSDMNRCAGPVEINYSPYGLPNDIAEHDYCGGARFAALANGARVRVIGGAHPGTYVVNGRNRYVHHGQNIGVLRGIGDLALQTCVGGDLMKYVGLTRI